MEINKEQRSSYEIQVVLNEKYHKGHFNSIKNLKRVLAEAQKLYDQNDDNPRLKQRCISKFIISYFIILR
jgi:hypothetical protein